MVQQKDIRLLVTVGAFLIFSQKHIWDVWTLILAQGRREMLL